MQEADALILQPNRRERRRVAAQTKRSAGPSCSCCRTAQQSDHATADEESGEDFQERHRA